MIATVALMTLLLAPASSGAAAAPAPCETFTRSSERAPPLARAWFAESSDERVVMCPQSGAPGSAAAPTLYFGEGGLTHRGAVCSYLRHGLKVAGSGAAARLQRYDRNDALAMALADGECPPPHGAGVQGYVETYDVTPSAFVGIMRLWSAITSATAPATAAGSDGASAADAATRGRLQAALGARTSATAVTRIVRIPGSALRRRYALFVKAPAPPQGGASDYVVYVEKHVRRPYEISAFAESY